MVRINSMTGLTRAGTTGKPGGKRTGKGKTTAGDRVHVTGAAALQEKVQTMLADMPDTRLERIEAIRAALEHGDYQMDERLLAVNIVANALVERSW